MSLFCVSFSLVQSVVFVCLSCVFFLFFCFTVSSTMGRGLTSTSARVSVRAPFDGLSYPLADLDRLATTCAPSPRDCDVSVGSHMQQDIGICLGGSTCLDAPYPLLGTVHTRNLDPKISDNLQFHTAVTGVSSDASFALHGATPLKKQTHTTTQK